MALKPPHHTPVAIHFGGVETRFLQLRGRPGHWAVKTALTVQASGNSRQAKAAEEVAQELRGRRWRGKDAVVGLGGSSVELTLVPVDTTNAERREKALRQAALGSIEDPEGVSYRFLQVSESPGQHRGEVLLLAMGSSEIRRTTIAVDSLGLRPVSLEMGAFGLARALMATRKDDSRPWGFLNLGFERSLFGILHQGQLAFLKPMQVDGQSLLRALEGAADGIAAGSGEPSKWAAGGFGAFAGQDEEEADAAPATADTLTQLRSLDLDHAVTLLGAVRNKGEQLAEEVRACVRHFHSRNRGADLAGVSLSGFGASLPEVEEALNEALDSPVTLARPFSELGIPAPSHVLDEEHLWTPALGLAMRGYE